jgi:proteasome regulatory subunit
MTNDKSYELDVYNYVENNSNYEQIKTEMNFLKLQNQTLALQNQTLNEEKNKLEKIINNFKNSPAIIGYASEVIDDKVVVRTNNGMTFYVSIPEKFKNKINLDDRLVLAQSNLALLDVLHPETDSRAKAFEINEKPKVDFNSIGGLKDIILEIDETIILPMTKPHLFKKFGIDSPKGVLLYGAPGTGKTLIAKAIASKTKSTFISLSASELIQKFIGEGAKVVKDLFKIAKEKAPSIIFIDELDAVAAYRMDISSGADREVNRTLTQLLVEIDGFHENDGIKVIAATNRKDILDDAILRPGRFDRVIYIPLPSKEDRKEIFKIYLNKIPLEKIDMNEILEKSKDLSGADIKLVCKEAAIFAIRENRSKVTQNDLIKAITKVKKDELEEKKQEHTYYR